MVVFLERLADAEDMTIGMADVKLPGSPRHVGRWPHDLKTFPDAGVVNGIGVIHPDRDPGTFVRALVAIGPEGAGVRPLSSTTLSVEAEE
mgnify:CR=1 FL=1